MDILSWLWWALTSTLSVIWSLAWFLLGGWVSALAQIAALVVIVFVYKYGWQRAPFEISSRLGSLGRHLWTWIRARETGSGPSVEVREVIRTVTVKEAGDVNLSTLLSLLVLAGLVLSSLL